MEILAQEEGCRVVPLSGELLVTADGHRCFAVSGPRKKIHLHQRAVVVTSAAEKDYGEGLKRVRLKRVLLMG